MRFIARVDKNQAEIVEALRACGASVQPIHQLGNGVPDLLVGSFGSNYLLEIKQIGGILTQDEGDWHWAWNGKVSIAHSIDEALELVALK